MVKRIRYRWGLRSLLLFVTVIAVFLGWRLQQRHSLKNSIDQLESVGCSVYFSWENPVFTERMFEKQLLSEVPYVEGRIVQFRHTNFSFDQDADHQADLIDFLAGRNSDLQVTTVVVQTENVNAPEIAALKKLGDLKKILYRSSLPARPSDSEKEELAKFEVLLANHLAKVSQLENELPNVEVQYAGDLKNLKPSKTRNSPASE